MFAEHFGASGALVKMEGFASGGNSALVYFSCADCVVKEARVLEFGGNIQLGKMLISMYGFISLALDTEGNMFGLHSTK
jgi:predicted enzyme related to lactoylglutathione lyase